MKLLGKDKDYYDFMNMYGIDPSIIFIRNPEVIKTPKILSTDSHAIYSKDQQKYYSVTQTFVFVAGSIYPMIRINYYKKNVQLGDYIGSECFYEYDKVELATNAFIDKSVLNRQYIYERDKQRAIEFLDKDHNTDERLSFLDENSIVVGHSRANGNYSSNKDSLWGSSGDSKSTHGYILKNHSRLIHLNFQDRLSGPEVYNSLENYLSSRKEVSMVSLTNLSKIQKAGFDKKISFRHRVSS